jgi:hypothetical protein
MSDIASRVGNRRSNCSLPVVSRLGFRLVTSVRFGLVLLPVPAHRTGLAVFPHPALGKDSRLRPRKVRGPVWQLDQAIHRVQRRQSAKPTVRSICTPTEGCVGGYATNTKSRRRHTNAFRRHATVRAGVEETPARGALESVHRELCR